MKNPTPRAFQPNRGQPVRCIGPGVDADAIEALRKGQPAKFKAADEMAAYELAQELLNTRNVSDATYARVKAVLGERGILDLVAVLGYYGLIAMSMKAFALVPEGVPDPLKKN